MPPCFVLCKALLTPILYYCNLTYAHLLWRELCNAPMHCSTVRAKCMPHCSRLRATQADSSHMWTYSLLQLERLSILGTSSLLIQLCTNPAPMRSSVQSACPSAQGCFAKQANTNPVSLYSYASLLFIQFCDDPANALQYCAGPHACLMEAQ